MQFKQKVWKSKIWSWLVKLINWVLSLWIVIFFVNSCDTFYNLNFCEFLWIPGSFLRIIVHSFTKCILNENELKFVLFCLALTMVNDIFEFQFHFGLVVRSLFHFFTLSDSLRSIRNLNKINTCSYSRR